ncbi:MAG: hypothetical protein JWO03_3780 [Bacteroidetes bacterium]|nr:hypothetical protein [Bacteroidota bacterium]
MKLSARIIFLSVVLFFTCTSFAQDTPPPNVKEAEAKPFICDFGHLPEYPGGEGAMIKFLQANIKYPDSAAAREIEGRVVIKFTIDEAGQPRDFVLVRCVSPELDAEALRVVKLLPKFNRSREANPVKVSFMLPINFKLASDDHVATISKAAPPRVNVPHIYDVVDKMPQFPGGDDSLKAFINKNLEYPINGADVSGGVVVGFVVNEDGSISDITIRKKLEKSYDAEAMRVIKLLPKFIPGKLQGKNVKVSYVLPIGFGLK